MINVNVSNDVFEKFPNITIGVLQGNLKNDITNETMSKIKQYINETVEYINGKYADISFEHIPQVRTWQNIFSLINAKKGRESSIVFLTKYALEHKRLFSVNPIVDLYNVISLKYGIPMGAYDSSKFNGNISLRLASKGEEFTPINSKQVEKTSTNEIVYADFDGVFCRCWNDRDADRTKIEDAPKEILIIFDGIDQEKEILKAGNELASLLSLDVKDFRVITNK